MTPLCMLLAVVKTLHLCMYVAHGGRLLAHMLLTGHLQWGMGKGFIMSGAQVVGARDYPLGKCFENNIVYGSIADHSEYDEC